MQIKLNTINDIKEFVCICNKYEKCDIRVQQNYSTVSGKSIIGMFSLNILQPLKVYINSKDETYINDFNDNIHKWIVT